jgi:hypothetical protein
MRGHFAAFVNAYPQTRFGLLLLRCFAHRSVSKNLRQEPTSPYNPLVKHLTELRSV